MEKNAFKRVNFFLILYNNKLINNANPGLLLGLLAVTYSSFGKGSVGLFGLRTELSVDLLNVLPSPALLYCIQYHELTGALRLSRTSL